MTKLFQILARMLLLHNLTSALLLSPPSPTTTTTIIKPPSSPTTLYSTTTTNSRRSFFRTTSSATFLPLLLLTTTTSPQPSYAATENTEPRSAQTYLYFVLRVREAAEQESRLIKSGKFKDVQRANIKLAVKFMLENYRLNDNFIAASTFLSGQGRIKAANAGTGVVQNLYTILEYFDTSDVENLKIGTNSLGEKETIVLKGLEATRKGIDEFVSYFPRDDVNAVVDKINTENDLNTKEFDTALGSLINPPPQKVN